jgi:hypothetical protein
MSRYWDEKERAPHLALAIRDIAFTAVLLVAAGMYGCPQYAVYEQQLKGRAELARADQNRQILVSQAHAEREAATQRAEAIRIMGQAAKDFPEYRQQEFIGAFGHALQEGRISQIIYVPTEAGIPILEAGRWAAANRQK